MQTTTLFRPSSTSPTARIFLFSLLVVSPVLGLGCGTTSPQRESISEYYWEAQNLRQIADNTPKGAEALRDLGVIYLRTGYFQKGYDALSRSLVLDRSDPKRWFYTGLALELLERPNPALATYERFLSLSSSSIYTKAMRGRVAWLTADRDDELFERLLRRENAPPSDSLAPNTYAVFPLECTTGPNWQGELGLGLSEIISGDIEQLRNVDMIEPRTVRRAHAITQLLPPRQGLTKPEWTGRMLGAGKIVGGTCQLSSGNQLEINLVVQDLIAQETHLVSGSADLNAISSLEKRLVRDLAEQLRIWIPDREGVDPIRVPDIRAIFEFSNGLENEDADRVNESLSFYQEALSIDPAFILAEMQRLAVENKILARASGEKEFIDLLVHLESSASQDYLLDSTLQQLGLNLGTGFVPGQDSRKQPPSNVGELPPPPTPTRN